MKKEYTFFKAIDFAQDETFIQWVREEGTNSEQDKRWLEWLRMHPDKVEVIEEARILVRSVIHERQYLLADQKRKALWSRIDASAAESDLHAGTPHAPETSRLTPRFYKIAAAVALLTIAGALLFTTRFNNIRSLITERPSTVPDSEYPFVEYRNDGLKTHTITLDDGSKITLEPSSVIRYPEDFSIERKVFLTGEAFFDVARDPEKPFSVHTSELVTQVLGTSFTIRAYEQEKNIRVSVRTGKVSVFSEKFNTGKSRREKQMEGAVLMPNQQVVYSRNELRMVKSLVDDPIMLPKALQHISFQFTDSPISEVFGSLEKAYGVDIVYDEETLANCYLNASLDSLSFHDKLRLISKGINAQYEILDGHVIISGNGCR